MSQYQLRTVRRYPNGTIVCNSTSFDSFLAAAHSQQVIMATAERCRDAVATTLIENGKRREPKISSHYLKIWEESVV